MRHLACAFVGAALLASTGPSPAADLYTHDSWPGLATDRIAHQPGDILTVVVYENATASDSANSTTSRATALSGQIAAGPTFAESGNLSLNNGSDDNGATQRSGAMVAQISTVVDGVLPDGDLSISGAQVLNVNGERTYIHIKGRVRPADISAANMVLSTRIADASIDFDGVGFVSRSAKPGIITRVLQWLGIP